MTQTPAPHIAFAALALALAGCGAPATDPDQLECGTDEAVVAIQTEDGESLRADFHAGDDHGLPVVVLFHQRPPDSDRTGYPPRIRDALYRERLNVLNVDRRGAGDSTGTPEDAYKGKGGLFDVEAAVAFATSAARRCRVDRDKVFLVGASNGTTSVLDYTVNHDDELPDTAAIVWMSPGGYTENQEKVDDHREVLEEIGILWMHPTDEEWSLDFVDGAPEEWRFVELGDKHGHAMFDEGDLEDEALDEITGHLALYR